MPSPKRDCNRAGEVKSSWVQLIEIFRQSQVHSVHLCWREPHDSESPVRQPWAWHWVHQALETRRNETPFGSYSVSPLTQMLRQEPRSLQPLSGLWSLHSALKEEITSSSSTKSSCYPLCIKSILSAAEPNASSSRATHQLCNHPDKLAHFLVPPQLGKAGGRSPPSKRHELSQPEKPGTCLYLP